MTRRRNGIWSVLAVLMILGLIVSACTAAPTTPSGPAPAGNDYDPEGELVTATGGDPDTIDPHKASFVNEIAVIMKVFEGLMSLDPKTLAPIPAAAASAPEVSADGLTYKYTLRDGLKFSDGSPLTANEFAFGYMRTCSPQNAGDYAFVLFIIKGCDAYYNMDAKTATQADLDKAKAEVGIKVVDPKTIEFTLIEPAAYFPSITYMWVGMPVRESDITKGGENWTQPSTYIGNGPFKLVDWKKSEKMVFERNENYRQPVKLKRWTQQVITEGAVAFAAYQNNELDLVGVAAEDLRTIEADATLKSQMSDSGGSCSFYYGFNTAKPPFDDQKVRLAFAKSFDRQSYITDVQKIGQPANGGFIRAGFPGYDETDNVQKFDVAAAKTLIAGSKYGAVTNAAFSGMKITYSANARTKARMEWVQQQWKNNLGVDIALDPVDSTAYTALTKKAETTPQLFFLGWCADFPDPQNWHTTVWISKDGISAGRTGYSNPEFDRIVRAADKEKDATKRMEEYKKAGKILSNDAPAAWVFYDASPRLLKPYVKGVTTTAIDSTLGQMRLWELYVTKKS